MEAAIWSAPCSVPARFANAAPRFQLKRRISAEAALHEPLRIDNYVIRQAELDEEFWAAAWVRAVSYYEQQRYARFIASYQKKYAEQEFEALKRRCSGGWHGQLVRCSCLIAVLDEVGEQSLLKQVIGTLDVSLRHLAPGQAFPGDDSRLNAGSSATQKYGYIANLCVASEYRRRGVAVNLMKVAFQTGTAWGLKMMFVHVNRRNDAAKMMYLKTGFQVETAAKHQDDLLLRRNLL